MTDDIFITEYQGGGRPKTGTTDHIIICDPPWEKGSYDQNSKIEFILDLYWLTFQDYKSFHRIQKF